MVFWHRINRSHLKQLKQQFTRYYIQIPTLNYTASSTRVYFEKKPPWSIGNRPTDFCCNLRSFAAPVQARGKKEEKDGPRLNDEITAMYVRLVIEEKVVTEKKEEPEVVTRHEVVSRREALERARTLKLDLVEVQRNADPPVCKIMDFHREKYEKEQKLKERASSKSEVTLRKGDCKEVRFSGKIEQKDLKMKADSVKRLMERGYRVKCMALPVNKKEEGEDLGSYLARLLTLMEDTAIIESGPHLEKKQAYVIVRHVKFGPSKKGGGKKPKVVVDAKPTVDKDDASSSTTDPSIEDIETIREADPRTKVEILASDFSHLKPEPPITAENRYKRSGPPNQFPSNRPMDNRNMGPRDFVRSEPQFVNQRQQLPPDFNRASTPMDEKKQIGIDASVLRNLKPSNSMPRRETNSSNSPTTTRSSFGIFSNPTTNAPPTNPRTSEIGPNENSKRRLRPGSENGGEKKFGIFSK